MRYLSISEVFELHDRIISSSGGSRGIEGEGGTFDLAPCAMRIIKPIEPIKLIKPIKRQRIL
jgi:hypothetical protein